MGSSCTIDCEGPRDPCTGLERESKIKRFGNPFVTFKQRHFPSLIQKSCLFVHEQEANSYRRISVDEIRKCCKKLNEF